MVHVRVETQRRVSYVDGPCGKGEGEGTVSESVRGGGRVLEKSVGNGNHW